MVLAILAGRKTQTRRVVTPQPSWDPEVHLTRPGGPFFWPVGRLGQQCGAPITRIAYGVPGDRLWVRETWRISDSAPANLVHEPVSCHYRADPDEVSGGPWKSGRFMPRWASRITLELTAVRVQRLQEITEEDALAEGLVRGRATGRVALSHGGFHLGPVWPSARAAYEDLWDSINAKRGYTWASNPFVWALTFRRSA
jgi:hypothetical protein